MTAEMGPRLRLAGAGVRYAGHREPALTDVDLVIAAGKRVGVTGRTGAGASTLALLAGGFLPRVIRATVSGEVTIDGVAVSGAAADGGDLLGRVGIVFATPANQLSSSKLTVREELAFGLENLGVPRAAMDARIDTVLDRLGIAHLAGREPLGLSGGEQQRVAVASIVAMGPRLLVLDEPTAQLDPAGTAEVGALIDELAGGGAAVLCVEHDPAILGRMDRVVVLDAGRVAGIDRPGIALGRGVAGRVGLPRPTLVRLAEAGGDVPPDAVFEIEAVAAGLARRRDSTRADAAWVAPSPEAVEMREVAATASGGRVPPPRPVPVVEVDGLVQRYPGGIEAVRGVSLRIEPGDAVALVGGNGSGKTTLVKHLVGLLRPAAGEVRLDGRSIVGDRIDVLAATVGFVFQDPDQQLFERTVEREVAFGPKNLGVAEPRLGALVEGALEAVGLTGERTTNPYDLDRSRRKLVALASILAMDPAIVILDEPTTGQDPLGVARVGAIIGSLRAAGRTVVTITHDMEFAAAYLERVVVMRDGEVVADGQPREVLGAASRVLLASTGLTPPPAALVAAQLGLPADIVTAEALLAALGSGG